MGLAETSVLLFICTHTKRKNKNDPNSSAINVPNTCPLGFLFFYVYIFI